VVLNNALKKIFDALKKCFDALKRFFDVKQCFNKILFLVLSTTLTRFCFAQTKL